MGRQTKTNLKHLNQKNAMSYEITTGLKIDKTNKTVHIKSACNNVTPRDFAWWQNSYFTKLYREKGFEALEIGLIESYISGNFHARNENKYSRAAELLHCTPTFDIFNWRKVDNSDENKEHSPDEYYDLLIQAINTPKLPKKYVITKSIYDYNLEKIKTGYGKKTTRQMKWYATPAKATKYRFKEQASEIIKCFTNSEKWEIEMI